METQRSVWAGIGRWLTGALILLMPISLVFFLGSQMAYGQVKGKFEAYSQIPEITTLAELAQLPAGQPVLLSGRVAGFGTNGGLVIFREKPAGSREVRFREAFPQQFPEFVLELADGAVIISPSQTRERIIQHELHTLTWGDRERSGFLPGDGVTVQGEWQPGAQPLLAEVTGISGQDKSRLMLEWETAFRQLRWARNGLGVLTLLSMGLLLVQIRRSRRNQTTTEAEAWSSEKSNRTATV